MRGPWDRLPEVGRPAAGQGVLHAGPGRRSQEPGGPHEQGAIYGQEEGSLRALYHLRRSYEADPRDSQTVYGLAFAYMELADIKQAQKHFQMVLEMEAPEEELQEDGCRGGRPRG